MKIKKKKAEKINVENIPLVRQIKSLSRKNKGIKRYEKTYLRFASFLHIEFHLMKIMNLRQKHIDSYVSRCECSDNELNAIQKLFDFVTIRSISNRVIKRLKRNGFVVQHYNSMTSSSVYIKLDYGVANSIRISDHHGKDHLNYRYNLMTHLSMSYVDSNGKYTRHYYKTTDVSKMIYDIISNKKDRLNKYGERLYLSYMDKNKKDNHNKKGFWKNSVIV